MLPDDDEERMPPKGEKLPIEEIAALRKWIAEGAKWTDGVELKPSPRRKSSNSLAKGLESMEVDLGGGQVVTIDATRAAELSITPPGKEEVEMHDTVKADLFCPYAKFTTAK